MTAPITLLFAFAAGLALAVSAQRALRRVPEPIRTRYALVAALLAVLVFAPGGLALFVLAPDWSLMYLANPAHLSPLWLGSALLLMFAGAPLAGFWAGVQLFHARSLWPLRIVWGALFALSFLMLVLGWRALNSVAYYDAYHYAGSTLRLQESSLFLPCVLIGGATLSLVVFAAMHVRRHADVGEGLPAADL